VRALRQCRSSRSVSYVPDAPDAPKLFAGWRLWQMQGRRLFRSHGRQGRAGVAELCSWTLPPKRQIPNVSGPGMVSVIASSRASAWEATTASARLPRGGCATEEAFCSKAGRSSAGWCTPVSREHSVICHFPAGIRGCRDSACPHQNPRNPLWSPYQRR